MKKVPVQEALEAIGISLVMVMASFGNPYAMAAVAGLCLAAVLAFRGRGPSCPLWVVYTSYGAAFTVSFARLLLHRL